MPRRTSPAVLPLVLACIAGPASAQLPALFHVTGDVDGDGFDDLAVDTIRTQLTGASNGYVRVSCGASGARLYHQGSFSVARDDFALHAVDCPPNHFGLFCYGPAAVRLPFGNGFRCVGGQTFRLALMGTGAEGVATRELDLALPPQPAGVVLPGSTWRYQSWYRDLPGGQSLFNLSDALEATFAP